LLDQSEQPFEIGLTKRPCLFTCHRHPPFLR
jgi:hypothetical protein